MQMQLAEKQPQLEQAEFETDELMTQINKEQVEYVEPLRKQTAIEEAEASQIATRQNALRIECDQQVKAAEPMLKEARKALNTIQKKHIDEIRALQNPPPTVKLVMTAVCVICQRPLERTPKKDNPKQLEDNWWASAQKFMANSIQFLDSLTINFKADRIPEPVIQRIRREFMPDPDFRPERVAKASFAAKGLCQWIIKLEGYDRCLREVKPKKDAAADAAYQYQLRMADLSTKQADLRVVVKQFEGLQAKLKEKGEYKEKLQEDIQDCIIKIDRAQVLLDGLGGEKDRWTGQKMQIEKDLNTIVQDSLLSAATISYLAPYTSKYRVEYIHRWTKQMMGEFLPLSRGYTLEKYLGDPVQVRKWQICGLPADSFSAENGIIMSQTMKWPLLIDPQTQANRYIKGLIMQNTADKKKKKAEQSNPNPNKKMESGGSATASNLVIVKPNDSDFIQRFEQSIRMGLPLLLENVGEQIDTILNPILGKQIFRVAGMKQIKFGDAIIDYADEFQLYITSRLPNPHYLPELSTKVTIINFSTTFEGLQEQLLNLVVKKENAHLDGERSKLIVQQYENTVALKAAEAEILDVLRRAEGSVLENEDAAEALKQSQDLSNDIKVRQDEAGQTEVRLEKARQGYTAIANLAALLFFIVSKMHMIDVMYQYSLSWFIQLFSMTVENTQSLPPPEKEKEKEAFGLKKMITKKVVESVKKDDSQEDPDTHRSSGRQKAGQAEKDKINMDIVVAKRVEELKDAFTHSLYSNVCRSIFEKDKLLFSFLLTAKILQSQGKLSNTQYEMLTMSITGVERPESMDIVNPVEDWLPTTIWNKLCECAEKDQHLQNLVRHTFRDQKKEWKLLYESDGTIEDSMFPKNESAINGKWSPVLKLCLLKSFRPDKLPHAIADFVRRQMGDKFLVPPVFDLEESFADSSAATPLIFVMPGNDPTAQLMKFAEMKKKLKTMKQISLGQNQGTRAERAIAEARQSGGWVLLQNCHLYPSWMQRLEQICEQIELKAAGNGEVTHPSFRLFLSSYPSSSFPTTVLQNGIKMTNEPPNGLKANMIGSFKADPLNHHGFFEGNSAPESFKKLAYSLTMFHAILLQRRNFGSLGWNNNYQFTVSDLSISIRQVHYFVDQYENGVPFNALTYMIGECNYGGRVTDELDKRTLHALLKDFIGDHVLSFGYSAVRKGTESATDLKKVEKDMEAFVLPTGSNNWQSYVDKMQAMPSEEPPHLFGFHPNADITRNINNANTLLNLMMVLGEIEGVSSLQKQMSRKVNLGGIDEQSDNSMTDEGRRSKMRDSSKHTDPKSVAISSNKGFMSSSENKLINLCKVMKRNLPNYVFNLNDIAEQFRIKRTESLNTVIQQETERYNGLVKKILDDLRTILLVQDGEAFVTPELQITMDSITRGQVPASWLKVSYPSLKPLASYIKDLNLRCETFRQWTELDTPTPVFWIGGFFFTQCFLTAVLQNFARKYQIEIDLLTFDFHFLDDMDPTDYENDFFRTTIANQKGLRVETPSDGVLISGLWFEGAAWDHKLRCITEQKPKQLYTRLPIIHLLPSQGDAPKKDEKDEDDNTARSDGKKAKVGKMKYQEPVKKDNEKDARIFECPLYQTAGRKNRVTMVKTPLGLEADLPPAQKTSEHWIKRGAAMLCQRSD